MLTDDLNVLFSGPDAIDVTIGATTFKALLDKPDEVIGGGMNISTEYLLTAKTSDLSGLFEDDQLTVDGNLYSARRILKVGDGLISNVLLSLETP
jgi:hypothetical protein